MSINNFLATNLDCDMKWGQRPWQRRREASYDVGLIHTISHKQMSADRWDIINTLGKFWLTLIHAGCYETSTDQSLERTRFISDQTETKKLQFTLTTTSRYHWPVLTPTANITNLTRSNILLNQTSPHHTSELFYLINVDTTLLRGRNYFERSPCYGIENKNKQQLLLPPHVTRFGCCCFFII